MVKDFAKVGGKELLLEGSPPVDVVGSTINFSAASGGAGGGGGGGEGGIESKSSPLISIS
jgi:hypothetical protein